MHANAALCNHSGGRVSIETVDGAIPLTGEGRVAIKAVLLFD